MYRLRLLLCCLLAGALLSTNAAADFAVTQVSKKTALHADAGETAAPILLKTVIHKLSYNPLQTARFLRAAAQDHRIAFTLLLANPFISAAASSLKEKVEQAKTNGVEVIRPAYGELNIVVRRDQLDRQLSGFASIALRTYAIGVQQELDRFEEDSRLLQNGGFNEKEMLRSERISSSAELASASDQLQQQLYTRFLLPDGKLLLEKEEQQAFAYLLLFYDHAGKPLGYIRDKLPLMKSNMVTNPTIVALMYHHFSPSDKDLNSVIVHPDRFREQLQMLKKNGYTPIRQQDLLAFMKGGDEARLPEKSVLITIDDGYESNYLYAYPALVEEQFFATIFATTVNINKDIEYLSRITWPQGREMIQSGRILIQSHTYESHYYGKTKGDKDAAATVSPLIMNGQLETVEAYKERMHRDLLQAKSMLEEQLHTPVFSFAYPYGRYSNRLIEMLDETGHELMYTVEKGVIRKGMNLAKLPRINVDGAFSAERMMEEIRKYSQ